MTQYRLYLLISTCSISLNNSALAAAVSFPILALTDRFSLSCENVPSPCVGPEQLSTSHQCCKTSACRGRVREDWALPRRRPGWWATVPPANLLAAEHSGKTGQKDTIALSSWDWRKKLSATSVSFFSQRWGGRQIKSNKKIQISTTLPFTA